MDTSNFNFYENKYFPHLKLCFALMSLIAFVNIVISCWWLRTIEWDGSRFAFNMLHSQNPYYELRPLHALFQFPTLAAMKFFPSLSPVLLIRIYLLTITLPIYLWILNKVIRSQSSTDLIPPFVLLIVGYVPGVTFALSSILETSFFFVVMMDAIIRDKKLTFYLSAFLIGIGHTALLPGLLLVIILLITDKEKRHLGKIIYLFIILGIGLFLLRRAFLQNSTIDRNYHFIIMYFKNHYWREQGSYLHVCTLVGFFLISDSMRYKWKIYIQVFLGIIITGLLLFCARDPILFNDVSYVYRLWTAGLALTIALYMWAKSKWVLSENSIPLILVLMIIGPLYLFFDSRVNTAYKTSFESIKATTVPAGCHQIWLSYPTTLRRMMLPLMKIIIDDKWKVDSLVLDSADDTNTTLCRRVVDGYDKFLVPMYPSLYENIIKKNGRFEFSETFVD